ncbi:MAG: thiamine biosynthesis protein [Pseudonocardiales bacterium]|nr:thiamine biosynthesis protein [Pseudonocardiales bacterium]
MKLATTSWTAWSCSVRLTVVDRSALAPAAMELVALLADVDAVASRFRPDSELSRANRLAGRPVPVSRRLIDFAAVAIDAARATDGAVDPTLGRDLVALGYDRDIDALRHSNPTRAFSGRADRRRDWRSVRINRELGLLTVPVGTALDLGATAKAHTADLAADRLARRYGTGVLVEIGGDLAVAGELRDGWPIAVAEQMGTAGQIVALHAGGMTTSTTTVRRWRQGDVERHHIVDPSTGQPADGPWRTATVAASSALEANTATTAAIVLGDAAQSWLGERGYDARLVDRDGRVHTVGGWPAVDENHPQTPYAATTYAANTAA